MARSGTRLVALMLATSGLVTSELVLVVASELEVALDVPDRIRPNGKLNVPITVTGAGASEQAHVTLAAVDVGILNLTAHQAPDAKGWYFGQRRLGVEMRDLYGRLIDGSLGVTGRLRTGGDGPQFQVKGSPPRERLRTARTPGSRRWSEARTTRRWRGAP